MEEIEVAIQCHRDTGPVVLEGRLRLPDPGSPAPGVVLCHPHPAGGGDMDVPLISLVSEALCLLGAAVLRFNFAGVGMSRGFFTDGALEPGDVAAAFRFLESRPEVHGRDVSVAGWSFGAWMALLSIIEPYSVPASTLVAVAPPLVACDWSAAAPEIAGSPAERYYVTGERDRFCPPASLKEFAWAVSERDAGHVMVLAGADHYLFGREQEVARLLVELL